jgi:hypothetical protein
MTPKAPGGLHRASHISYPFHSMPLRSHFTIPRAPLCYVWAGRRGVAAERRQINLPGIPAKLLIPKGLLPRTEPKHNPAIRASARDDPSGSDIREFRNSPLSPKCQTEPCAEHPVLQPVTRVRRTICR